MADSSSDLEKTVLEAKLAEEAKLYNEMVKAMNEAAKVVGVLKADERDFVSVIKENVELEHIINNLASFNSYLMRAMRASRETCYKIVGIIDELIPKCSTPDDFVLYCMMKGDYSKYLAEVSTGSERTCYADVALRTYLAATQTAVEKLPRANPIRLGLALNLSLFYLDIFGSKSSASLVAKQAYDEAKPELESLNVKEYNDSCVVLLLLSDIFSKNS